MYSRIVVCLNNLKETAERRSTVERLKQLSDHQLDDIGLFRNQLDSLFEPATRNDRPIATLKATKMTISSMTTEHQSLQGCG